MCFVRTRVYAVVTFNRSPWLHEHLNLNNDKRVYAQNDFAKTVFTLMNNAMFGKMMENFREHQKYDVCADGQRLWD